MEPWNLSLAGDVKSRAFVTSLRSVCAARATVGRRLGGLWRIISKRACPYAFGSRASVARCVVVALTVGADLPGRWLQVQTDLDLNGCARRAARDRTLFSFMSRTTRTRSTRLLTLVSSIFGASTVVAQGQGAPRYAAASVLLGERQATIFTYLLAMTDVDGDLAYFIESSSSVLSC